MTEHMAFAITIWLSSLTWIDGDPLQSKDSAVATRKLAAQGRAAVKRPELAFTTEREAAALAFVKDNHAELLSVLVPLRDMERPQYEKAIIEIFRTSETLGDLRDRDPKRYELQRLSWQLKSQIDLAAATLAKSDDESTRSLLRSLLQRQLDNQIALMTLERDRAKERAAKLDGDIQRLKAKADESIEQRMRRLSKLRPANRQNKKNSDSGPQG